MRLAKPPFPSSKPADENVLSIPDVSREPYDPFADGKNAAAPRVTPKSQQSQTAVETMGDQGRLTVGAGVRLKGEIGSCDTLVVRGSVESEIEAAALIIAPTGVVIGDATVDSADVHGRFEGTLRVKESLIVHAEGRVSGTIHYTELEIERGGQISGKLESAGMAAASPPAPVVEEPEAKAADAG